MSRRIAAGAAAVAIAAALASTASAAGQPTTPGRPAPPVSPGGAVPLSPDEAEALATATVPVAGGETTTAVSPAAALAASSLPGAETSVAPGSTPAAAVGLAPGMAPDAASPTFASLANATMCWADRAWWQWGTWPYQQQIANTTYWCAVYGQRITYRSTTVTTSGTLCSTNWRASQLIGGGVGFHGMTIRASAGFSCPTVIPWVTLHPTHHLDTFFGDRGRAVITGHA